MLAKKMAAIPHRWGGERKNSFFLSSKKTDTVLWDDCLEDGGGGGNCGDESDYVKVKLKDI